MFSPKNQKTQIRKFIQLFYTIKPILEIFIDFYKFSLYRDISIYKHEGYLNENGILPVFTPVFPVCKYDLFPAC